MQLTPEAEAIKARLDEYLATTDFTWNPDESVVERVLNGLAKRQEKTGAAYCPCRLVSGDEAEDRKIVCPCAYHAQEIAEEGQCHCRLFVKRP